MTATGVFPLSMFDPVHLGIDENGEHVHVDLAERNMLLGGEPGGGKSNALNLIVAHGALSADGRLVLVDGKQVELGQWRHCAEIFVGPSISHAIDTFQQLQDIMNGRYDTLLAEGRRKITRHTGEPVYLVVIDEYAYFSATVGDRKQQAEFAALARDLVARGRAAGVIVILATQRPSHQVIDPSMRDLFGYRWAFRCTTDSSSRRGARQRLGERGLHRRRDRPARPRRRLAAVRKRHPQADQGRLPVRRRHPPPRPPRRAAARAGGRMTAAAATIPLSPGPPDAGPGLGETADDRLTAVPARQPGPVGATSGAWNWSSGPAAATSAGGNASSPTPATASSRSGCAARSGPSTWPPATPA